MIRRPETKLYALLLGVGLAVGGAVPLGSTGCCCCPELGPEFHAAPHYRIRTDRVDWVNGSGEIRISETTIFVTYETLDASAWEVEYVISDSYP